MDPRLLGRVQNPTPAPQSTIGVNLVIAKGRLVGRLTTSDPKAPKLLPAQINDFHASLATVLEHSSFSSHEFEECVAWIACHVARSRQRTAAVGEYFVKLSESFDKPLSGIRTDNIRAVQTSQTTDGAPARMSILNLIGAVLIFIRDNPNNVFLDPTKTSLTFGRHIVSHAIQLVRLAAPSQDIGAARIHAELRSLLGNWTENRFFTRDDRLRLRDAARSSYFEWLTWLRNANFELYQSLKTSVANQSLNMQMPAQHGSFDDAWYSLPVAATVPLTHSNRPIKISTIKPLAMYPGPADPELIRAVDALLMEGRRINATPCVAPYKQDEDVILNGLGQRVFLDPVTGKRKREDTYYAQKEKFAECMKNIRNKPRQTRPTANMPKQIPPPPAAQFDPQRFPPPPPDYMGGGSPADWPPPPPPPPHGGMPIPPPFPAGSNSYGRGGSDNWRDADRGRGGNHGFRGRGGRGRGGWR